MRTTVDIPNPTYRRLKSQAVEQGCAVKELILRGVERELQARSGRKGRIRLPILASRQPGSLRLTNEQVYDIIPFP